MGRLIFLIFAGFLATASAHGQSAYSWNVSSGSAGFTTAANWLVSGSPPAVSPGTLDDVTIGIAGTYTVTLATNATISTLTLNNATATFAQSAGTFSINNAFTFTNGIYNLTGGTLNLNGGMTMAAGTMTVSGSTINLTGNLTLNGGAINLGIGTINGGTILTTGGLRVNNTSSNATLNNVTLGDVVNADVLRLNSGFTWRFQGTTDFRVGFTPTLSNLTNIRYLTTRTLNTDFVLQDASLFSETPGQTITISAGRTITGVQSGSGGNISGTGNWINNGTIQITGNGSQLAIDHSGSFVNNGVILSQTSGASPGIVAIASSVSSFVNNGTLRTSGSAISILEVQKNLTTAQLGNWDTTAGGEVRLRNNTLTNTGDTLNITTARGPLFLSNAVINGGTVQADVGVRLTLSGSATLNNVTLGGGNGNLDVLNRGTGGSWSFQGTTDFQVGFTPTLFNLTNVRFLTTKTLNSDFILQDASLFSETAGQTITIDVGRSITRNQSGSGGGINGPGNWINNGTLQVTGNGSTMSMGGTGSFVNNGTLLAQSSGANPAFISVLSSVSSFSNTGILRATTNSFLSLRENMTTTQLGSWDTTGGGEVVIDQMTLTNTGDTLNVTAARGPLYSSNAIILNGTIQADPGVRFSLSGSGGGGVTLNNVTLGGGNGNLDVLRLTAGGTWIFQGTTDFTTGFVPTLTNGTRLYYLTTRTLNTDINLASGVLESQTIGQTISIGVGRSINASPGSGGSQIQGSGNWINNGTIRTTGNGASLSISNTGTFNNQGSIIAESTGASQSNYSLTPTTLSNYNAGTFTLTDGSYRALTRGTIASGTREFRNLAGNAFVELGLNSIFAPVEGKLTTIGANAGFIVSGGKTYTVTNPTNSFTNNGLVRVTGTGSQITIGAGINLTNYNIGTQTLTGGIFEVLNGGALNLGTRTTNTVQTGTRVTLDGSTASFSVIEGGLLTTLSGQLSVSNGKSLTVAATGLTITNGGVLSGHLGTITGGTVRVTSSGTIAPGNSPGQITIGGGLDVGGTLELDISQGGGTNNSNGTGNTTPGIGFDTIIHQAPPGTNVTLRTNTSFRLLASDTNLASPFWSVSQGWLFLRTTNGAIQFSNGAAGDPVSPLSQIPTANVSLINSANGQPIDYIAQWPNSIFYFELSSFESGQNLTLVWNPVPEPKNLVVAFFVMFGVWLTFRSRESAFKRTNVWRSDKTLSRCFSLSLSPK